MCGEYRLFLSVHHWLIETPPHVWGILSHVVYVLDGDGNTPTCVGNTHSWYSAIWMDRNTPTCVGNMRVLRGGDCQHREHPHMCGEYLVILMVCLGLKGTPPHVWGIPDQQQ